MHSKNKNGLISGGDTEQDADYDAQPPADGEAVAFPGKAMRSKSSAEAESVLADEFWNEATRRLATAVLERAGPAGDGDKSSGSRGSGSGGSAGDGGNAGIGNDSFESAGNSELEMGGHGAGDIDLLDIIARRWLLIGAIVILITSLGGLFLSQLTPLYTGSAEVIIEPQGAALEDALPEIDEQSLATVTKVLTSGIVLDSVIDQLDLVSDPEFNSMLDSEEASLQLPEESLRAIIRAALLSRLDIEPVGVSRVIAIQATSESGSKAANISNMLIDVYLQYRQDSKVQASSETSAWLEERIADLQTELKESEQRAGRFRSDSNLLEAGGSTLVSQQLINLNDQLMAARAEAAAAQAELSQVRELVRSSDSNSIRSSAGVLQSRLVQDLRKQQVALERQIAELSSELGPAHPRMRQLKADAEDLEFQISLEVDKVVQGLENSVMVAQARAADLEREARLLTAKLSESNEDEIQLRALERESTANQELLETLLGRQKALVSPDLIQSGLPEARVISYALPQITPSFPLVGVSMGGIFIVSLIVGFVVAFILEIRRLGISTLEQLEAVTKLKALGFVPHVSTRQQRGMLMSVLTNSKRPFAQAMRTLNWLMDESVPEAAKVILVTSAIPGEGKTTTAISIGRIKAAKGYRTIIVDADIRKPSVHRRLHCQPTSGLVDVIESKAGLAKAIFSDEDSSLDVLAAGRASSDALDLVEAPEMVSVLKELKKKYDYIIVDSPPVAVGPDACILSRETDTTILTVRSSTTPVNAVKYALRILRRNGGHITGTVLTMVEQSRSNNRKYGYFDYYGYYGEKA